MSLLEDARRLAETDPFVTLWNGNGEDDWCFACGIKDEQPHDPDCPWLTLPRIVAALEAAERLVEPQSDEPATDDRRGGWWYSFCLGPKGRHFPDCPWQALVAALEDDE